MKDDIPNAMGDNKRDRREKEKVKNAHSHTEGPEDCERCFCRVPFGRCGSYGQIRTLRRYLHTPENRKGIGRTLFVCHAKKTPNYAAKHEHASQAVEYEVVDGSEMKGFAVGSELVPLDVPVVVRLKQRGFFPPLDEWIQRETELEVVMTRDADVVDGWVRMREKEEMDWIGYMIHERPMDLKQGKQLAYVSDPAFETDDVYEYESETEQCVSDIERESPNVSLPFRLDAFNYDSDHDDESVENSKVLDLLQRNEQQLSGRRPTESDDDMEHNPFGNVAEDDADDDVMYTSDDDALVETTEREGFDGESSDPPGNKEFDFYPTLEGEQPTPPRKVVYRIGAIVIEDENPPPPLDPPPLLPRPPTAFTSDAALASTWQHDSDGSEERPLPDAAIAIAKNIVSVLSICYGKHVLILQLRRMNGIGPALYNLLYGTTVRKLSFEHRESAALLAPLGMKITAGRDLRHLIIEALERKEWNEVPPIFHVLKEHQVARVLAGVDISDRDFYVQDWNNPLLCERELVCLAKEAFALSVMAKLLSRSNRTLFFNIDIFVKNPIPPSYLEQAQLSPATVTHCFTVHRGHFYEDMGKLLEGVSFDIIVIVTRDVEVAEQWARRKLRDEVVQLVGYHHEWVKGQQDAITATFAFATEHEVLICQQIYMPSIPPELRNLVHWRYVRKCTVAPHLYVFKKDMSDLILRGVEQVPMLLLELFGKKKKKNLPKVIRDIDFTQAARMFVGVDEAFLRNRSNSVRWDKPVFTEDEIEYQAVRTWLGWALIHIFSKSTIHHGERLRAYLQGSDFVPKKQRIPSNVRKRVEQTQRWWEDDQSVDSAAEVHDAEDLTMMDRLATRTRDISHEDFNQLLDTIL